MSYAKRMLQRATSRVQYLVALAIVSTLALSLGIAISPLSQRSALLTAANDQPQQPAVVAPGTSNPAVAAVQNRRPMERVPYEMGWELYDHGWAGGPAPQMGTSEASALIRVPYEAGWELYDDGWAGGPKTLPAGTSGN